MAHTNLFEKITNLENLFDSWQEFRKGKRSKPDVQEFERHLEDNLFALHKELAAKTYRHGQYTPFTTTDPKVRRIHKASVRDRIVHHAVYRVLYPIFDRTFIYDSYSCRFGKGTHKTVDRLELFTRKVSRNYREPCFALKCDIKKFFYSVDHKILFQILKCNIADQDALWLLYEIISSFERESSPAAAGIPIGNLTSQLFANIYLNQLDKFIKHDLRVM